MKATYRRGDGILTIGGVEFKVTNVVRNLANGRRKLHKASEVVRTMGTMSEPYMPVQFPIGDWVIGEPREIQKEDHEYDYKAPYFIPTNAWALVKTWALDDKGGYDHETESTIMDGGYGFHFSKTSRTTLGCGRLESEDAALELASLVVEAHKNKDKIELSVIA